LDDKNSNIKAMVDYLDELKIDISEMLDMKIKTNKF